VAGNDKYGVCNNDEFKEYLGFGGHIAVSISSLLLPVIGGCRNHFGTLFQLVVVENPTFAVGISITSVIVPEI